MPEALWTPEQANAERNSVVEAHLRDQIAEGARLEQELKQLDPYLEVGFVGEGAPAYPGILPGRWHVIRRNPDGLDTFLPIAGPDGEYREPSFQMIDEMKRRDLWKRDAVKERMDAVREEWIRRDKQKELFSEQSRDEAALVYRAAKRVSGDGGITRRWWGKGRVKADG